ncbi:CoA transferase [Streptomyces sp. NPDC102282]|uniref:CoA transferase n=1 Tax=Streptomyces sp. NPDC102282 TaxID=3366154 RepID=UPI003818465E
MGITGVPAGRAGDVALHHLLALGAHHEPGSTAQERLTLVPEDGMPDLVCEVLSFPGVAGPPLGETALQAVAGLMAVHGHAAGEPRRLPLDYVSACSGVLAVQGVLAALIARQRGTPVSRVSTAQSSAALLSVSQYLAAAYTAQEAGLKGVMEAPDAGQDSPAPGAPDCGPPFLSRDGVWFELEALDSAPWLAFWTALGLRGRAVSQGWQAFAGRYAAAVAPLSPLLHQALAARDFSDIARTGRHTGLTVCRIRAWEESRAQDGPLPVPWSVRPLGTDHPRTPPPAASPPAGLPLAGLLVVEATRRIQGPMAGHILGMLGAHVVRVEPPGGDPLRGAEPTVGDCSVRFRALNDGKSVIEADLKTPEGQDAVRALAADADVFLHNWAPGKAEAFGLDADTLCSANPALVHAHASGWGPSTGPDRFPGTDFMVQAHSGLAWQMAGDGDRPRPTLMTVVDVLGGLVSAEGILAGLLARERGGRAQRVDSSLLSAAAVLQRPAAGPSPVASAHPQSSWEGPYPTSSGYIALSLPTPDDLRLLRETLRVPAGLPESSARLSIHARLRIRPARSWIDELGRRGVEAVLVQEDLAAVARDPRFRADIRGGAWASLAPPWRFRS